MFVRWTLPYKQSFRLPRPFKSSFKVGWGGLFGFQPRTPPYVVILLTESDLEILVERSVLLNALAHDGKSAAKPVIGQILGGHPEFRPKAREVKTLVESFVGKINAMSVEELRSYTGQHYPDVLAESEKGREKVKENKQLPELPNAEHGTVTLRLPPEPSGYLHIGHAYAGFINHSYAKEYGGRLILRFEDTNPTKVELEYYDAIQEAYAYLGITYDEVVYESDHFELYYAKARQLVEQDHAYVCSCSAEESRANRAEGKACEHRDQSRKNNLDLWEAMLGDMEEGTAVLRLRGDLTTTQEALRDPTLMRILDQPHPRLGDKYRVYPLYDFAVSVEDTAVTHVLRSEEFIPKTPLQNLIRRYLGLSSPEFVHFSRLRLKNTPVQKRHIRGLIKEGVVRGWDDPRLSTVFGLRSRGIVPETIRRLVYEMRLSSNQSEVDWGMVLALNRKVLDPIAPRLFAVVDPVLMLVEGLGSAEVTLRNHPTNPDMGGRVVETADKFWLMREDTNLLTVGSRLRLLDYINVEVVEIGEDQLLAHPLSEGDHNIPKVQWVPHETAVPLELRTINELYTSLAENELNPRSVEVEGGYVENSVLTQPPYTVVQLQRVGFACVDDISPEKVILNRT